MKTVQLFFLLLFVQQIKSQNFPIDLVKTKHYFDEVKTICDIDNGKLWGKNLWAPVLLIDENTRFIVANFPDKEGILKKEDDVFVGYFPENMGVANSTTNFGNELWMMVKNPLPEDEYLRNQLCVHELYHRLQDELKLVFKNPNNDHLDNLDARILLKLEWTAMEKAMNESSEKKKDYLSDALVFRNYRRFIYPKKDLMENELEIFEGLAEYTGYKLCSENDEDFKNHVLSAKNKYWDKETYVRSFAYYSALLYGYILDQINSTWRTNINPDSDLGLIAQNTYKIKLPENLEKYYLQIRDNYNYENIIQYENDREKKRIETLKIYRSKFTEDTILTMLVPNPNIVFNPNNLIPLDTLGTVYPTIKIISEWGILQVNSGGCLFDWKKAIVPARNIKQENNKIIGEGWEITLDDKWELVQKNSNYELQMIE